MPLPANSVCENSEYENSESENLECENSELTNLEFKIQSWKIQSGLGALRTSVGNLVHLVSTCQDTVFFGSGSDSSAISFIEKKQRFFCRFQNVVKFLIF